MPQRSPGPQRERSVDVGDADDALAYQVIHLAGQRSLQPVGDMPGHFLVQADGPLAQSRIEFRSAPDRLLGGLCSADDLDQRDQVRRIERMRDDAALRVQRGARLDLAHRQAGRARGDDHIGRQQFVELAVQLLLEIDALGSVLLDEIGTLHGLCQVRRKVKSE